MTRTLSLFAVAALLAAPAFAEDKKDAKDDGWIQLFNGKDFTGWKLPDPPSGQFKGMKEVKDKDGKVTEFIGVDKNDKEVTLWKIKDGVIVGR